MKRSNHFKNTLTLITGSGIANLIPLLLAPILTRLYTPADYGQFSFFMASFSILVIIVNFRFHIAIMLPKTNSKARILMALSVLCSSLFGLVLYLTLWFALKFNWIPAKYLNMTTLFYFLPLAAFLYILFDTGNYWLNRNKDYKSMACSRIIRSITTEANHIIFGLVKFGAIGLVLANILGNFAGVTSVFKKTFKRLNKSDFNRQKLLIIGKEYSEYPLLNTPTSLMNAASTQAPVYFLTQFFSSSIVGLFGFSQKLIAMPGALVGQALSQVYYQQASESFNNNDDLRPIYWKTLRLLFAIGFPASLILFFLSEEIFALVFSEKWRQAGYYTELLAPAFFVRFIIPPLSSIFFVTRTLKWAAYWKTLYFFSSISYLIIACQYLDIESLLWIYSIHEVLLYCIYFYMQVHVINKLSKNNKQ